MRLDYFSEDRRAFIEKTIQSVVNQTVRPIRWVIVNDGSMDGTRRIIRHYAALDDRIEAANMPESRDRSFAARMHAFNPGYDMVKTLGHHVVGNVDADISSDKDVVESLLSRLKEGPGLGVVKC